MRLALRYIILSGIALAASLAFLPLHAQDRCGTLQYSKSLHPDYELRRIDFEKWLSEKRVRGRASRNERRQTALYRIPIVVHVIHNGESIGSGPNITDAQIMSQLRVLNEDFTRQNADASNTPPVFAAVASGIDIEFILAKQDPDGQPTNGIVRVNGHKSGWTINEGYTMKDLSYWPAEQYMNIWVCNLSDQYIGYAQLPESDLPGHENSSTNRLTDGVVIWYKAFGSDEDGNFNLDPAFNKGRTTTHEVGHFFGLNHTWGDDSGCSGTDYVSDTPNQADRSVGCPTHPKTDACGEVVMFQNFLDYTDDDCMNLFTEGQVERMTIVIENSPRRNSLLSSPGLEDPAPLPNDIGVRTIIFPDASVCSNDVVPVIEVRNYGNNLVTSARIRFILDGASVETKDFILALDPEETAQVSFASVVIPSGEHNVIFEVLLTNGGQDSGMYNDTKSSTVLVPAFASAPFALDFATLPSGWITQNFDGQITWDIATAPDESPANKALKLNFFDYEDKIGEVDVFISPVLDLTGVPAATLTFDVAHARYQGSNDRLQVIALVDCQDISQGVIVYDKAGEALKTAGPTSSPFRPTNETQWRTEFINLNNFVGAEKLQLAFVGINDWGNNVYIDNVTLRTEETLDAAVVALASPSPVTCADEIIPHVLVRNTGSVLLTSMHIEYRLNGGSLQTMPVTGLNIPFGAEQEINLSSVVLADGNNTLDVSLKNPNGLADHNPENNSRSFIVVLNSNADRIPLRENFETDFTPAWTAINQNGGMNWTVINTNFGRSVYFNSFANEDIGDEAWLVSPVLDFSRTNQATMLFDLSSAQRGGTFENVRVLASTDCGVTYSEITYNAPAPETSAAEWAPSDDGDWHQNISVNLNTVANHENVRIAFVVRNQNANNVFLDNVEFFVTGDPDPIEISELFSIYGYGLDHPTLSDLKITFNLPTRQDVRFSIINTIGQMETDGVIADVLNQTFPLELRNNLKPGLYIIRVEISGKFYSTRIMVF
jgi:hypothetical protein